MANKLIIVVGSGPGIGSQTAAQFASQGFSVALLSRDPNRLKEDAKAVEAKAKSGATVQTYPVDAGDHKSLRSTLEKVKSELGSPEVVLFNAARVAMSEFGEIGVERLSEDFQFMNVGLYVTAVWAMPLLEAVKQQHPDSHPSFLITGGGIWKYPIPVFFALSMQKAAQVNLASSLVKIASPKGIHVATISVNGIVEDKNPVINAKNVASKFWELYSQDQNNWDDLINVGDLEMLK